MNKVTHFDFSFKSEILICEREDFLNDAHGRPAGNIVDVKRRRDFDDVHVANRQVLENEPDEIDQLPGSDSPRYRRSGSWRKGRIEHVDIQGEIDVIIALKLLGDDARAFLPSEFVHVAG